MTLVSSFLRRLLEQGRRPGTIDLYRENLGAFQNFLEFSLSKNILQASPEDIEAYLLNLEPRMLPNTASQILGRVNLFYRFLLKEDKILKNPLEDFEGPGRAPALPRDVPDEKKVADLLSLPSTHSVYGLRDQAILELFYSTGIRNKELRDLKLYDPDLKDLTLHVREGKGGKGRLIPLGRKASEAIFKYLKRARPLFQKKPGETALFLSSQGNPLTEQTLRHVFLRYRNKIQGLEGITPHKLRHSLALHMLRGGAPIDRIQEILGHKTIQSTQIYTRLYPKDLKIIHQKYHPQEKRRGYTMS